MRAGCVNENEVWVISRELEEEYAEVLGVVGGHKDRLLGWCPEETHPGTGN